MPCPMFIFCVDQGLLVLYPFFLTSSSIISWSTVSAGSVFLRIFIYWKSILFFYFSKIFLLTIEFYQDCYSSPHHVTPLKMSLHCLLTCIVSKERFAVIVVCLPLCGGIFFLSLPPSLLLWFSVVEFMSGWAGFLFCLFVCFGIYPPGCSTNIYYGCLGSITAPSPGSMSGLRI